MKKFICMKIPGLVCIALLAGCGKPAVKPAGGNSNTPVAPGTATANAPAIPAADTAADGPKTGEKICFACNGTGTIKCLAPGCQDGLVDCPGPCLKLDRGEWVHLEVAGHPPTDLWHKFYHADGASYDAYNQNHAGHVIAMQNDRAVDTGPCKICGGKARVPCSVCKGTGRQVCLICGGKKYVPAVWSPTNNPWLNNQGDAIHLTDGRVFFGKIVGAVGTDLTIKTRDGKFVNVENAEVMAKPDGSSPAAP